MRRLCCSCTLTSSHQVMVFPPSPQQAWVWTGLLRLRSTLWFGEGSWKIVRDPKDLLYIEKNMWCIWLGTYMLGQMVSSQFRLVISAVRNIFFTWVGLNWWLETLCGVMPLFWVTWWSELRRYRGGWVWNAITLPCHENFHQPDQKNTKLDPVAWKPTVEHFKFDAYSANA